MTRSLLSISGLLLVLFLVIHLSGLLLAIISPISFELFAGTLHKSSWLILFELLLIAVTVTHISLTSIKAFQNHGINNASVLVSRRKDLLAVFASSSQPIGGAFLLFFLLIHLAQFRFPRPLNGEELNTLHIILSSPSTVFIYILGSLALFLHLFHGIESSQRSLGLLTSNNALLIRYFARSISFIISAGFILITISLNGEFSIK